ncbi:LysR substrate-binding domain-containing protein [Aurantivibrio plasticivorans]
MDVTDFEPSLLRTFMAVAELGSLSKASDRLCLAQPTISLRVKRLEELTQSQLFTRHGQGVALTEEGTLLLRYAKRILDLHSEAWSAMSSPAISGPVRIGLLPDLAMNACANTLFNFAKAHPGVRLEITEGTSSELRDALDSGRLDIAVLVNPKADDEQLIVRDQLQWIAGKQFDWEHDRPLPLVLCPAPCRYREMAFAALEEAGIQWQLSFTAQNIFFIREAVGAGLGVTIRGRSFLNNDLETCHRQLGLPDLPSVSITVETAAKPINPESVDALRNVILMAAS